MATFTEQGKIKKRLAESHNNGIATPTILAYNPKYNFTHTTSAPYLLTITETTPRVVIKTVIEYDAVYPTGNVITVYPQEIVQLDAMPDNN